MSMHFRHSWAMFLALGIGLVTVPARASEFSDRMAAWQNGRGAVAPARYTQAEGPTPAARAPQAAQPQVTQPQAAQSQMGYTPRTTAGGLSSSHGYHPPDSFPGSRAAHGGCATCGNHGGYAGGVQGDWAEPPVYQDGGYHEGSCGPGGCGGCGAGGCGGGGGCQDFGCQTMVWARFEVLLWWREGRGMPPLVTTDPVNESSTTAGILPNAGILFGNEVVGSDVAAGGRFDIGTWCDPRQCCGIGWRFWGLGKDGMSYDANSLQEPVLAIPFVDASSGDNDALLVAYPGLRSGSIHITANSEVLGNDVYGRFLLCRDCDSRWDFITGYHFSRINDDLSIRSQSTVTEVGGSVPLGTVATVEDQFGVQNEFHGGILGLMWERDCGCLSYQLMGRMSIGNMRETSIINGSTTIDVPNQNPVTTAGGLFTADSNIGRRERDEFTAVTEIGVTLGYRFNTCTRFTLGYTFLYWNDVIRPETAINQNIGAVGAEAQPQFRFQHSDYWVQGLNLGFVREF